MIYTRFLSIRKRHVIIELEADKFPRLSRTVHLFVIGLRGELFISCGPVVDPFLEVPASICGAFLGYLFMQRIPNFLPTATAEIRSTQANRTADQRYDGLWELSAGFKHFHFEMENKSLMTAWCSHSPLSVISGHPRSWLKRREKEDEMSGRSRRFFIFDFNICICKHFIKKKRNFQASPALS